MSLLLGLLTREEGAAGAQASDCSVSIPVCVENPKSRGRDVSSSEECDSVLSHYVVRVCARTGAQVHCVPVEAGDQLWCPSLLSELFKTGCLLFFCWVWQAGRPRTRATDTHAVPLALTWIHDCTVRALSPSFLQQQPCCPDTGASLVDAVCDVNSSVPTSHRCPPQSLHGSPLLHSATPLSCAYPKPAQHSQCTPLILLGSGHTRRL